MTSIFKLAVDALFVFSVIFIWLMLLYQFVLTLGGFFLWKKEKNQENSPVDPAELPGVSVLIPAKNEEKVIGNLIKRLRELDYPQEKLEIIVINDGSQDETGSIVSAAAEKDKGIKLINIPPEVAGRGKGAALNTGLESASNEIIAVYDADNMPEKDSLKKLCHVLMQDNRLAAVTGKFRAYNRNANLLTRLINIESVAFQWIIQAGRWFFIKISFLSGTNFVIRKFILKKMGGWNEKSLVEDSELTFRIYEQGYLVKFLPSATTWEQEPEKFGTWIRQRTRWARGTSHIISEYGRRLFKARPRITSIELLNLLYLYYLFIFAILISDLLFILSLVDLVHVRVLGPYRELWGLAFLLFILEIIIALSFEKEDSFSSVLLTIFAYFTYTKLWAFVVLRSFYQEFIQKREIIWDKTERFNLNPKKIKPEP